MINGFLVYYRKEKEHEACMLNMKAQAVKDVVLRKLKDRLQRCGMTLQDYLMSSRKSSTAALTLRDFCKVWPEICLNFLSMFWFYLKSQCFFIGQKLVTGTIILTIWIATLHFSLLVLDSG